MPVLLRLRLRILAATPARPVPRSKIVVGSGIALVSFGVTTNSVRSRKLRSQRSKGFTRSSVTKRTISTADVVRRKSAATSPTGVFKRNPRSETIKRMPPIIAKLPNHTMRLVSTVVAKKNQPLSYNTTGGMAICQGVVGVTS